MRDYLLVRGKMINTNCLSAATGAVATTCTELLS
jgi:hypothetical protein